MALTLQELKEHFKKKKPTHKYGAVRCERDGHKFPSKLERNYYDYLIQKQKIGEVLFFLMQVPFHIPEAKYLADFQVFLSDGTIEFIDVKGKDTPMSILKRKQVEALYPVEIKVITGKDF